MRRMCSCSTMAVLMLLYAIIVLSSSPSASQNVECWLEMEVISPHLVFLHPGSSNSSLLVACNTQREQITVGSLSTNDGGLGVGVVSALVGPGGAKGLMVALFESVSYSSHLRWTFDDISCWFELQEGLGFNQSNHILDIDDHLRLEVMSMPTNISDENILVYLLPLHFGDITVFFENAMLFDFISTVSQHRQTQTFTLDLWQRYTLYPDQSKVTFQIQTCSLSSSCFCNLSIIIQSGCPPGRGLMFSYPTESNLRYLPSNYRPPSPLGKGIPSSPHVYNADPSLPFPECHINIATTAIYKQCLNRTSRSECDCLPKQMTEIDIAWSDCIEMAYRHLFADIFPLTFNVRDDSGTAIELVIIIEELNNRTDYKVLTEGFVSREIRFTGAGLYHFRANLTGTESFCPLTTQFMVFVEKQPLKKSEEQIISSLTAVGCGLTVVLAYMIHLYFSKPHPVITRKLYFLTHKRHK